MLSKNADAGLAEKAALGGMLILGTVILTAVLGFFVGIPIGIYTLLVPLAVLLLVAFFRDRTLFWAVLAEIGFAVLWAVLCAFIYDSSFDGMYYHKQAVITLKEGWNPVYESCLTENQFSSYLDIALWLDNYPKGLWSFSAAVYALTNLIETAKVVNLFFVICVFALGYDVMRNRGEPICFSLSRSPCRVPSSSPRRCSSGLFCWCLVSAMRSSAGSGSPASDGRSSSYSPHFWPACWCSALTPTSYI